MRRFSEISESTARKIDRTMTGMAGLVTLEDLEKRFVAEAGKLLPVDCMGWNNWAPDMSRLLTHRSNHEDYYDRFNGLMDIFGETVGSHPVIAANQLASTTEQVMRMSDFQAYASFRENPLFREVYRHLDSHYQLSYTASVLTDRRLVLTWNRRVRDFTDRDQQILHFMGLRLGVISRRIEERQHLEKSWRSLCGFVDARVPAGTVGGLGRNDAVLLTGLLKSRSRSGIARELGIRRDSVDKRLGSIRERLGLENHQQLLSALADLKNADVGENAAE